MLSIIKMEFCLKKYHVEQHIKEVRKTLSYEDSQKEVVTWPNEKPATFMPEMWAGICFL